MSGRPFTGDVLDRVSVQRKDRDYVTGLTHSPDARAVAVGREGVLVYDDPTVRLARVPLPQDLGGSPILLGVDDTGAGVFALDLDRPAPSDPPADDGSWGSDSGTKVVSLRDAATELPHAEGGLAGHATALLNWHRRHRFCANCGAPTRVEEGGYMRACPKCGSHHFPRTDPCVIMTVGHNGRLLLGRRTGWPEGRLSVLAGFVSPGESAEEAVVREIEEESGIVARDPVFVTSQPWPFPASLMLGFHAESDGGEPRPTDGELDEVHWIDRDEVRRMLAGEPGAFALPGPVSIARFLIERWAQQ